MAFPFLGAQGGKVTCSRSDGKWQNQGLSQGLAPETGSAPDRAHGCRISVSEGEELVLTARRRLLCSVSPPGHPDT